MRKFSLWVFILALTVSAACGQDAATQQQIDQLNGKLQDLLDTQAAQGKRLDALEKSISDLQGKLDQPAVNNSASADDLKKLAEQVQEMDKKRQDDNDLILKQIASLGKVSSGSSSSHHSSPNISPPTASGSQKGYEYAVVAGDTVSAIAKAYRAQGVKVTTAQILAANPGLNANGLTVGEKIFIPDPNAK
jgi:phage tail protein X